jgi:hypothetical protein
MSGRILPQISVAFMRAVPNLVNGCDSRWLSFINALVGVHLYDPGDEAGDARYDFGQGEGYLLSYNVFADILKVKGS